MFGKILEIKDNIVVLENNSKKIETNYLNLHVVFPDDKRKVVGEIIGMNEEEIRILLVGEIVNDKFYSGVIKKPDGKNGTRIVYKSEAELLLGSQDLYDKQNLYIGKSVIYDGFNVTTNKNAFFSNHFAIVGNSGSGKSCGVARIMQNIFYEGMETPNNSHIVLFDVYGEYNTAFCYMNNTDGMGYKYYTTDLKSKNNLLQIPAYFLDVDDLALLLNVTNNCQLPIIEKALKYVYIFKGEDETSKKYKNSIIASCVLDILSSGKSGTQIRDQVIAVLSRYNTPDININAPIVEPGYTRTIKQCLNIDAQGKISALSLVIDYLNNYSYLDLNDFKPNMLTIYDLEDLYNAFEFALISEGTFNSDKAFEEYNSLKIRLHQIINSDLKEFFSTTVNMVSKNEYIKNLFEDYNHKYQIINMNLNYIDDRTAKILTKIYARMFFEYATNLDERTSYPIHIILEEAHRYVQNDNDINILGYNIFDRITKEGRKYGVILGLITQRPSELSVTALSQCQNFLIFKMFHPEDIKIINNITSNVSFETIEQIKNLNSGTCMAFGSAFKLPLIVKLDLPDPMPKSTSADIVSSWYK